MKMLMRGWTYGELFKRTGRESEGHVALSSATLDLTMYAQGFADAGFKLLNEFRDKDAFGFEVLPGLFLLRHSTELLLKKCLSDAHDLAELLGCKRGKSKTGHHSLWRLFELLSGLVALAPVRDVLKKDPLLSQRAVRLLKEIDKADPDSVVFRYPSDKGGHTTLPITFDFSIENFVNNMGFLLDELAPLTGHIEMMRNARDPLLDPLRVAPRRIL